MKEASGELSMTVVVIAAAAIIIGLLGTVFNGNMANYIQKTWQNMAATQATKK